MGKTGNRGLDRTILVLLLLSAPLSPAPTRPTLSADAGYRTTVWLFRRGNECGDR